MKPTTTIVLLTLLALPANAQDGGRIFHTPPVASPVAPTLTGERLFGTARTDSNSVTTFHDASGRVTGSIRR